MFTDETALARHISGGGHISGEDDLPNSYKWEVMRLMVVFIDSELAGAAGFTPFINSAPGLRERGIAARIVSEKFSHAEMVLRLMERFSINPRLYLLEHAWDARLNREMDLRNRRIGGDRRLNLFHYPLEGWLDALVMNLLMGSASAIQLSELADCSYQPLADRMTEIAPAEARHAEYGEEGLKQALQRAYSIDAAQVAVDYWTPRVAATFGRLDSDRFDQYRKFGLRRHSNAQLLETWRKESAPRLDALGLALPS